MKNILRVLLLLIVSSQLQSQDKLITGDNNISINIINSVDDDYSVDVTIINNISKESYTIENAFYHLKEDIFLNLCDLDEDGINEYVLSGLTGGNGIPYCCYVIDLKISTKPVCEVYSCCNPNNLNFIIGFGNRKRIIVSENSKFPYSFCYKYLNGRLNFDSNKDDIGFIKIYYENISSLKHKLDDRRNSYWKNTNSLGEEYKMILDSYLIQNVIVYDDYNIEKDANYYNYYFKSENKDIISNIRNRYSNLLNDKCLFEKMNDY